MLSLIWGFGVSCLRRRSPEDAWSKHTVVPPLSEAVLGSMTPFTPVVTRVTDE